VKELKQYTDRQTDTQINKIHIDNSVALFIASLCRFSVTVPNTNNET